MDSISEIFTDFINENEEEEDEEEKPEDKAEKEVEEEEKDVDPRDLLTKEQVDYWKTIFDQFDSQKKLKVPCKTIGFALRFMGLNPTKLDIKKHIEEVDPLNKGMIDFQSFLLPIAQRINQEPENHEKIIAAFKTFDEEGKDFVYTDRLLDYLTSLGEDLEDFEIDALLKLADPKGLNKIYYVDFVEKLMGVQRKQKNKGGKKEKKKKKK